MVKAIRYVTWFHIKTYKTHSLFIVILIIGDYQHISRCTTNHTRLGSCFDHIVFRVPRSFCVLKPKLFQTQLKIQCKSFTWYMIAKLKLIVEKCLTYVFNPLTYVLVFVARIQDASFPTYTLLHIQEHNITNSMYTVVLNIKYSYR